MLFTEKSFDNLFPTARRKIQSFIVGKCLNSGTYKTVQYGLTEWDRGEVEKEVRASKQLFKI